MANKVASQKAPSKRGRRARSEEELRRMVRDACEQEFLGFAGRPWSEVSNRVDRYQRAYAEEIEQEAREIHRRLRAAVLDAVEFAERPDLWGPQGRFPGGGGGKLQAAEALRRWAPAALKPIQQTPWFLKPRWPVLHEGRATLVHVLDRFNIFGLPPNPSGQSRFFTAREFAIVSLLAGNWPLSSRDYIHTAAEVIKAESNLMREHITRHGYPATPDPSALVRGEPDRSLRRTPKRTGL